MKLHVLALLALAGITSLLFTGAVSAQPAFCDKTANLVMKACVLETKDDWRLAKAICTNLSDQGDRSECFAEALDARDEGVEEEKFYAPGIGPILELDEEGNRTELVELIMP